MQNNNQISDEVKLIAQAFAKEAVHKVLCKMNMLEPTNADEFYKLFSNDRGVFSRTREAVIIELRSMRDQMEKDATLAFEKIPVKYSQHRN